MKSTLAILLMIVGAIMLVVGYTAERREKNYLESLQKARVETATWEAKQNAEHGWQGDSEMKRLAHQLSDDLEDRLGEQTAITVGASQCASGWMLIAVACIILVIGPQKTSPGQ